MSGPRPGLHLLRLARNVGIREQLWIEEALLRHDKRNWCIMKDGEAPGTRPTIVLGIGGKPDKLVNQQLARRDGIPMLRRFSGGGTVIVDQDSLFITFIMNTAEVTPGEPYPRPIMSWTATVYQPAFSRLAPPDKAFELKENDYVFGLLKFGGNAQSIVKDRWLHHTSFLWDYRESSMAYLQMPDRKPEYRGARDHASFLTRLKDCLRLDDAQHDDDEDNREAVFREVESELGRRFEVQRAGPAEVEQVLARVGGLQAWGGQGARTKEVPHVIEEEGGTQKPAP